MSNNNENIDKYNIIINTFLKIKSNRENIIYPNYVVSKESTKKHYSKAFFIYLLLCFFLTQHYIHNLYKHFKRHIKNGKSEKHFYSIPI